MTAKPPSAARPVPIRSFMMRRVFLQGSKFVCGICRIAHSSVVEANNCLHQCWQKVLQQAPWTAVKRLGKTEYHCVYCQRTYDSPELATNCATDCAEKMTITSHEAANILGSRAKKTFGQKPPIKITLKVPYKIGKSTVEHSPAVTLEAANQAENSASAEAQATPAPLVTTESKANGSSTGTPETPAEKKH